ncbi:BURP domain-containing protein 3 [Dendrobium catenatum]|uniref:BURP domain-containing protein 3 n=1 Tax=Dendrobium catenatum TaxID=906689 RepID=A0A2I0XJ51_9ASPA|nr:BURP domain-containing protein 3 [Dendrobium catenatum]
MNSFKLERGQNNVKSFGCYNCINKETQTHNDPIAQLFFLKDSLKVGTKMTLELSKSISMHPFLSVEMAKATPFSSTKLTEILGLFNITWGSLEAKAIQQTLEECEEKPIEGEIKHCVTSLEAMVDFVKAEIGNRDVNVIETTVKGGVHQLVVPKQVYLIRSKEDMHVEAKALVSCHPESYPKAVYYCHKITNVEAYKVHLLGSNGVVVDTAAICHIDTSAWSPHYLGFKILKVKPGTEPICHFLPRGHLIFAGK